MSNLIDRQAAIKVASKECYEFRGIFGRIENSLNKLPTVEAIPIEWIEEWLDKTTGTRDGEDISQLPEQLKFAIQMINLMEMDWEKENENR